MERLKLFERNNGYSRLWLLGLGFLWIMVGATAKADVYFAWSATGPLTVDVPQGEWLVLSDIPGATVTWEGEKYPVGHLVPDRVVIPVGLRQDTGVYRLQVDKAISMQVRVVNPSWEEQSLTLPDQKHVDLSLADQKRVARENARIGQAFARRTAWKDTRWHPPFEGYQMGNRFGSRRIINGQPRSRHTGADYGLAAGTSVFTVASGQVVLAEEHFFAGNSVFIDHGDGLISMYFHLASMDVREGDAVAAGAQIGRVGSTGRSTGPHLHFGLRYRNHIVDPDAFMRLVLPR